MYDYLVVGAGLFGAVFACEARKAGKQVLVIDKRDHIAGNVYTEDIEGIHVHRYGAHIFHTNDRMVWDYVTKYADFNRFTNSPVANYKGELYSLPFNMYTFNKMWGVVTPEEAAQKIEEQKREAHIIEPKNLEEQAISRDIRRSNGDVRAVSCRHLSSNVCRYVLPLIIIILMRCIREFRLEGIRGWYRICLKVLRSGCRRIIWKTGSTGTVWRIRLSILVLWMLILTTALGHWNTEACVLKRSFWIRLIFREMLL